MNTSIEVQARNLMDVGFRYTWVVENYVQTFDKDSDIDSPEFDINVNGFNTKWSLALRHWTDEDGKRLTNPVVVCLNLLSSSVSSASPLSESFEPIQVRYQFGIWNAIVKQYEYCPVGCKTADIPCVSSSNNNGTIDGINLQCIGTREVIILDRHLLGKNIEIFCKIMLVRQKSEQNTLAVDLWNKLRSSEFCDVTIKSSDGDSFPAHKTILACRSSVLVNMVDSNGMIHLDSPTSLVTSLLQFIYTDRVEPFETPQTLLKLAVKLELQGLKEMCERALIESITPQNIANLLMIADTFGCDLLKKAALGFCEENSRSIIKNLAWKVMEQVNPDLFEEVCQQL